MAAGTTLPDCQYSQKPAADSKIAPVTTDWVAKRCTSRLAATRPRIMAARNTPTAWAAYTLGTPSPVPMKSALQEIMQNSMETASTSASQYTQNSRGSGAACSPGAAAGWAGGGRWADR